MSVAVAVVSVLGLTARAEGESATNQAKAPVFTIQVTAPDGKPEPNMTVVICDPDAPSAPATLTNTTIVGGRSRLQTDAAGRFILPSKGELIFLAIANSKGFSIARSYDLTNHPTMVVRPWGRIEGIRMNRNRPLAGQRIRCDLVESCVGAWLGNCFWLTDESTTDAQGHFVIERVPSMEISLSEVHSHPSMPLFNFHHPVEVKSGETTRVTIETQGRTVVGHIDLDGELTKQVDLSHFQGHLRTGTDASKYDLLGFPKEADTIEKRTKLYQEWLNTDAARHYSQAIARCSLEFHEDGSFIGEMCDPGEYWLNAILSSEQAKSQCVATLEKIHVTIPAATDNADAPVDIGKVSIRPVVNIGEVAPDFAAKTFDGQPIKLSDFRGKYVLLDFWSTTCPYCIKEMPDIKAIHETFGKDGRLVVIGLSLDSNPAPPKKFVKNNGFGWTQVFLGDWSKDQVTPNYGVVAIPANFLIGPDGKVLAITWQGSKIMEAAAAALPH